MGLRLGEAAWRGFRAMRLARARMRRAWRWTGVRILGYHRIAAADDELAVHPDAFRRQLEQVVASDVRLIRLDAALELLAAPVAGRFLCVTFDDGYLDNLETALPIMRELGVPGTIFVPTAVIDGTATFDWYAEPPPALSWADVAEVVRDGLVDVQAHTRTHPHLPRVGDERAHDEIVGAKRDLERHVPYDVTSFCYPAGLFGARDEALVREAGYRGAVTTHPGVNPGGRPLHRLHRTLIYGSDDDASFRAKLEGRLDAVPLPVRWLYRRADRG